MITEHHIDLERNLAEVTLRLTQRFPHTDPAVVEATVRRCAEQFADARIDTFVSILVERRSAEALRAAASTPQDLGHAVAS